MSNKRNVQGAIAQALLNKRVFRDLKMAFDRMKPSMSNEEALQFLKENEFTFEDLEKAMIESLEQSINLAFTKIKEIARKDFEKAKREINQKK
jgi:hypothetical protein